MTVRAIIETPQGSQNKYEFDGRTGRIRLDRILSEAIRYPANYGFVPETWGKDNAPLDILVYGSTAIYPGVEVTARVVGVLLMQDEYGPDAKLISMVDGDPRMSHISTLDGLGRRRLEELRRFFQEYNAVEGVGAALGHYQNASVAERLVKEALHRWHALQRDRVPQN